MTMTDSYELELAEITEAARDLAELGAHNLAALIIALANDGERFEGKENIVRLLTGRKRIAVFNLPEADLILFERHAKQAGLAFTIISDKQRPEEVSMILNADYLPDLISIFGSAGYDTSYITADDEKKRTSLRPRWYQTRKELD